ncbi:hypothetical protein STXM2123_5238 [Streptomyces sp. F-3]|nr:hypothetical protein STXM2123_5238 [Streptomyces sp. F-3]
MHGHRPAPLPARDAAVRRGEHHHCAVTRGVCATELRGERPAIRPDGIRPDGTRPARSS